MTTKKLISAGIAFAILFLTSLIALWSGEGVSTFSDITPIQYTIAGIGALISFGKDVLASFADPSE